MCYSNYRKLIQLDSTALGCRLVRLSSRLWIRFWCIACVSFIRLMANPCSIIIKPNHTSICKPLCIIEANVPLTKACYMTKPNSSGAGRYAQPTVESRGEWNSYWTIILFTTGRDQVNLLAEPQLRWSMHKRKSLVVITRYEACCRLLDTGYCHTT